MAVDPDLQALSPPRVPHPLDYLGLVATVAPFVIARPTSAATRVTTEVTGPDGRKEIVTSSRVTHRDPVALGGGAVGLAVALATFSLWKKTAPAKRLLRVALTLVVFSLGSYQLLVRGGLRELIPGRNPPASHLGAP